MFFRKTGFFAHGFGPLFALLGSFAPILAAGADSPCPVLIEKLSARPSWEQTLQGNKSVILPLKKKLAYPEVPSAHTLSLSRVKPQKTERSLGLSPGLSDPFIERLRDEKVFPDFKILSDARPRFLTPQEKKQMKKEAGSDLKKLFSLLYTTDSELVADPSQIPTQLRSLSGDPKLDAAFAKTEEILSTLVYRTPSKSQGSLLPLPYPILVAAPGRFQETYYWDSYFGLQGLLATGRIELAQMQVENFLTLVRDYGHIPNGNRDYYLSRSQPPFVSSMVREVWEKSNQEASEAEKKRLRDWLKRRAFALVKNDYENFWMNPNTRWDPQTGLNHFWDDLDLPRPERHGYDQEETLGKTYRDVRAAAESGLDFTDAHGSEATQIADVLLNSLLFKTERDLAWMADQIGDPKSAQKFREASERRKKAIYEKLWNEEKGQFENFHLGNQKNLSVLTANTAAPLFVGLATSEQAKKVKKSLKKLEQPGGLMASELTDSSHQWDGYNGWAPQQMMAVAGLQRYGFEKEAKNLARKWTRLLADEQSRSGLFFERMNVKTLSPPETDTSKYPTQPGFLWTNASFVWMLKNALDIPIAEPKKP